MRSAIWNDFVAPVLDRTEPHIRLVEAPNADNHEALLDPAEITATIISTHYAVVEATTDNVTLLATRQHRDGGWSVWIRAESAERADKARAEIEAKLPPPPQVDDETEIAFWQVDGSGDCFTRMQTIDAPSLDEAETNYPGPVAADLTELAALQPHIDDGRILLWHGPPGTGKTSAIRALAGVWRATISVEVLLDPDRVLSNASTLLSILLDRGTDRWRLLVVEDADELLRVDAKDRVGQALSRLLNLGDGMLGQDLKVLVLITTNEPIGRVHPALVRPGRCLLETEFRRFTRPEAAQRLDGRLPPGDSFSLAELAALKRGQPLATIDERPGLYL